MAGELGRIATVYRLWPAAEAAYRNAVQLGPDRFDWPYLLANLLSSRGQPQEALRFLVAARALEPDHVPLRVSILEAHFDLGDLAKAEGEAESGLATDPNSAPFNFLYGQILLSQGRWQEAAEKLEFTLRLDLRATAAHHGLAAARSALGDPVAAARHRALAGDGRPRIEDEILGGLGALSRNTVRYEQWAQTAYARADYDTAIALLLHAKALAPTQTRLNLALAASLSRSGRLKQSRDVLDEYLQIGDLAPSARAVALLSLGLIEAREGDNDAAISAYAEALKLYPTVPNGRLNLGSLLCTTGQVDDGLQHLTAARRLVPADPATVLHLAQCLSHHDGPGDAAEAVREAIRDSEMPTGNHGTLRLAELRLVGTDPAATPAELENALRLGQEWYEKTKRVEFVEINGHLLYRLDRPKEAALHLRAALQAVRQTDRSDLVERLTKAVDAVKAGLKLESIPLLDS